MRIELDMPHNWDGESESIDGFWKLFYPNGFHPLGIIDKISSIWGSIWILYDMHISRWLDEDTYINILRWVPIIAYDRDWDNSHLERILYYKIKHMRKNFYEANFYVGMEAEVKAMDVCIDKLSRIIKDDYIFMFEDLPMEERYRKQYDEERRDRMIVFNVLKNNLPRWWW